MTAAEILVPFPAPFETRGDLADPKTPLVFASPHSGRIYPDELMAASRLDAQAIRRSEDVFVDRLIEEGFSSGVSGVICRTARVWIDVNRDPWELDPAMFEDALPAFARSQTARVAAGLGSIARMVGEGQEIYARKLTFAEAEARIDAVHKPYHQAVKERLDAARERFGVGVLVDWHSMPSAAGRHEARRGRGRPDVVLGDRHGAACGRALTQAVRRQLESQGYAVTLNSPYAGGYTTQVYGRPDQGLHALQIEIDRGLYVDEATLERTPGFERLRRDLNRLFQMLIETDWATALR